MAYDPARSFTPDPSAQSVGGMGNVDVLRDAVTAAAGVSGTLWLSYLFTLFYLLVAAGGVRHADLFFETPVKLPFLSVDLPLRGFFWLGPTIFVIMHAYVLLHFVMLNKKIDAFKNQFVAPEHEAARAAFQLQLPSDVFVQLFAGPDDLRKGIVGALLWLILIISLVLGPLALLLFFQLQFLAFHHEVITWIQRIAIVVDIVLIWKVWPAIALIRQGSRDAPGGRLWQQIGRRPMTFLVIFAASVIAVVMAFYVATFPGERLQQAVHRAQLPWLEIELVAGATDGVTLRPESPWSNVLVLPGLDVIDHTRYDTEAKIEALTSTVSLRGRHLEGAVLTGATLRKIDLTGAFLADANLDHANMKEADLNWADLAGASAAATDLTGGAIIGAHLKGGVLYGSIFDKALLDNTDFDGAMLAGASFQGARLYGTTFRGACLNAANFQGARFINTKFDGAGMDGAVGAVTAAAAPGEDPCPHAKDGEKP